jgi:hypothetical protein
MPRVRIRMTDPIIISHVIVRAARIEEGLMAIFE